jgi:hypothetical protein
MRSTLHDPLLTAENRLWRAVLEQAYTDAESGCESTDEPDDAEGPPERIRARCYLRGDSKQEAASLAVVCGFAEIPADRVLTWARRNYPRPATPAQTQKALAIGAIEAQQNRARTCEHAAA